MFKVLYKGKEILTVYHVEDIGGTGINLFRFLVWKNSHWVYIPAGDCTPVEEQEDKHEEGN